MPLTLIGESVFARCLSALKDERVEASKVLTGPGKPKTVADRKAFIEDVRRALYCSKMISYAQGYMLLRAAEKEHGWHLNLGGIALMWRGGCIIRSVFLGNIKAAFDKNPDLTNLLLDEFFSSALIKYQASWRKALIHAIESGVPTPAFSTGLHSTMATARQVSRQTCCRRSATSSARTPTSEWTSRAASSSTPTGPDTGARSPRESTTHRFTAI